MMEQHEQRYCIKFCQKLGDTQVETIRKIQQAFGDDAMSNSWIKEWYEAAPWLKRLVAGFPPLRSGVRNRT
jgi:hypothetical protein